eukprot:scaffold213400_cov30-Prasinocladus_malaysianus.AAC.2
MSQWCPSYVKFPLSSVLWPCLIARHHHLHLGGLPGAGRPALAGDALRPARQDARGDAHRGRDWRPLAGGGGGWARPQVLCHAIPRQPPTPPAVMPR